MTAPTLESLNVRPETADEFRAQIVHQYRFERSVMHQPPIAAAGEVMRFWGGVIAQLWRDGHVNDVAAFTYLTACQWYEQAQRLPGPPQRTQGGGVMTALIYRHLTYTAYTRQPDAEPQLTEWAIEKALQLAVDYDEPGMVEVARVKTGWTDEAWASHIIALLDLADEVDYARLNGPTERFHCALDEYRAALTALAAGPDTLTALVDSVQAPAVETLDELSAHKARRGGA